MGARIPKPMNNNRLINACDTRGIKESASINFMMSSLNLKSTTSITTKAAMLFGGVDLKLPMSTFFD